VTLEVRVSPGQVAANVGDEVRLECQLANNVERGQLAFEWSRADGRPLSTPEVDDETLVLSSLSPEDMGDYVCRVEDRQTGDAGMSRAKLTVVAAVVEDLKIDVRPNKVDLVQGDQAEFSCEAVSGGEGSIYVWEKVNEELEDRHVVYAQGRRLKIEGVLPADRGYFRCRVDNARGQTAFGYVLVAGVEARQAPEVEVYPSTKELLVERNGVVYVQCRVVSGSPEPVVEWKRRDGRAMSPNVAVEQEGYLLVVKGSGEAELGEYVCVARNAAGEGEAMVVVRELLSEGGRVDEEEEAMREAHERRLEEEEAARREKEREEEEKRRREMAREAARRQREREEEEARQRTVVRTTTPDMGAVKPDARTSPVVQVQEGETVSEGYYF